ncbi:hypothetical protein HgNV_077 [Homarus gammarus nudivirus]|uniref:Uncharacterized protein n=1 Tax=Homarus gammarus nudivirus TaxID=2509616 RepID=A0A411HBB3_9VIRU|nr:hypothetical protein KM727_gp77 [Homarus gammarus nudivirus]QBB28682.1 hypothetical protein HgNV_077 [Homarus gammarus nudivirus]
MIKNEDFFKFLDAFSIDYLATDIHDAESLQEISCKNHNLFYWINATLEENIYNHQKNIDIITKFDRGHSTIFNLFAYTILNLDAIFDKLDTRNMVKWIVPIKKNGNEILTIQNVNMLNISNLICDTMTATEATNFENMENVLPIIKPKNALIISKVLDICPVRTYYPTDLERYPIQRSLLYNIFQKFNFDMDNDELSSVRRIKKFINSLPNNLNTDLLNNVLSDVSFNDSDESTILFPMIRAYSRAAESIPSRQQVSLTKFENSIIPALIKQYPHANINFNVNEHEFCDKIKFCDSNDIASSTIVKVLTNYESFYAAAGSYYINALALCPIQVSYILSVFPFYKSKILKVKDGIVKLEDILIGDEPPLNMKDFYKIKEYLKFNGDYTTFKTTIELLNFPYKKVIGYIQSLYDNRGFKCSAIITALLNFHINSHLNDREMYNLISKLSSREQMEIDKAMFCKVETTNTADSVIDFILTNNPADITPISLQYTNIEKAVIKIRDCVTFDDAIQIAANTNFNCIPLIKYFRESKRDRKAAISLLLLFSSAPTTIKTLLYRNNCKTVKFPRSAQQDTAIKLDGALNKTKANVYTVEDMLTSTIEPTKCQALLDYYKTTKDENILKVLNLKLNTNEGS